MTARVCYLERADRGGRIERVRMIGARDEDSWTLRATDPSDPVALGASMREAAEWVRERLAATGDRLSSVCIDADGSLCGWVTSASAAPEVVGAMIRQGVAAAGETEEGPSPVGGTSLSLSPDLEIEGGASVQALAEDSAERKRAGQERRRLAVLAVPDASVRLFLDHLDGLGVETPPVRSIFHAASLAWDPTARAGAGAMSDRIVAESVGTSAVVLTDPRGRLLWAWSRGGELLAAGGMRLPRTQPRPTTDEDESLVRGPERAEIAVSSAELARLVGEWIAWASQLGAAPSRITLVMPGRAWTDGGGLGGAAAALGAAWPGSTIDAADENDPIAATVRVAMEHGDAPGEPMPSTALVALSRRPGRTHRAMIHWASAAIAAVGVGLGVLATQVWRSAGIARDHGRDARERWFERAATIHPVVTNPQVRDPIDELERELERQRRALRPRGYRSFMPVMQELETLSHIIGNDMISLERLSISNTSVLLIVNVPDTAAYEELRAALSRIAGSKVVFPRDQDAVTEQPTRTGTPGGLRCVFSGLWVESDRSATPPGGGA
ncbi:MAG: hypothetical protein KIS87_07620 [Phycisphaeraceae bacterium]|nr:hypothetical protein [Phycisphaeraceae bacterium]